MDQPTGAAPARRAVAAAEVGVLARACHPLPCVAVTAFGTTLAAVAGNGAGMCLTLAVALLAGQLSIGWSNDRHDVARDRAAGRTDKPLVHAAVPLRHVDAAIVAALAVTVAASLVLGWRPGVVHLVAVACGWLYNVALKSTWLSWLPYALAFGALPVIATFALPGAPAPAVWAVIAGALLGVAAHLVNTLPDLGDDRRVGIWGLPQHLGARPALLLAVVLLLAGSVLLVLAPAGDPSAARWIGLAATTALTLIAAALSWNRPADRWAFTAVIGIVALDLALLVLGPSFVT